MPAPKGNKNAEKSGGKRAGAHLHIRVSEQEKREWERAAKGAGLSGWVRKTLKDSALRES